MIRWEGWLVMPFCVIHSDHCRVMPDTLTTSVIQVPIVVSPCYCLSTIPLIHCDGADCVDDLLLIILNYIFSIHSVFIIVIILSIYVMESDTFICVVYLLFRRHCYSADCWCYSITIICYCYVIITLCRADIVTFTCYLCDLSLTVIIYGSTDCSLMLLHLSTLLFIPLHIYIIIR